MLYLQLKKMIAKNTKLNSFQHYQLIFFRNKSVLNWAHIRKTRFPTEAALQHFDSYYSKVYQNRWPSIRLGLVCEPKYCALVNSYLVDNYETVYELQNKGAVDLIDFYRRHYKWSERYKLRMKILKEKSEKKKKYLAEKLNVPIDQIKSDVEVSDVSDTELDVQLKDKNISSMSEAENVAEMFETELENGNKTFIESSLKQVNLNDFMPVTEIKYEEPVRSDMSYFNFYQQGLVFPIDHIEQNNLVFPSTLKVLTFPRSNITTFDNPEAIKNVYNFYKADGADILSVLALDIQENNKIVTISAEVSQIISIIMTLRPSSLLCNEEKINKITNLKSIIMAYVPSVNKNISYNSDNHALLSHNTFDRVLVNPPSTQDRISANFIANNIFKVSNTDKRLNIPQRQKSFLLSGLKALKPGGILVYTTSSLSPIQNDCVVEMSLKNLYDENGSTFIVHNLKEAFRPLKGLFKFHHFKFGQQIVPFLPSNFGPRYIAKLEKKIENSSENVNNVNNQIDSD